MKIKKKNLKVVCNTCGKNLIASPMRGTNIDLYNGVICNSCRKIECTSCKEIKGPLNAPCSKCGSEVSPAFAHLI